MDTNFFYIFPFLGPILAIAALIIVFTRLSSITKSLAETFPRRSEFTGEWLNFQTMQINSLALKGCISLGFDKEFLYIKTNFFPLNLNAQIPWSSVRSIRKERRFLCSYYVLVIDEEREIKFYSTKAFEKAINENLEAAKLLGQSALGEFG